MTNGLSLISKLDKQSYNSIVNTINMSQKELVELLESAYRNSMYYDDNISKSYAKLQLTFRQLQNQIFINQFIINNFNASPPYQAPTELLNL